MSHPERTQSEEITRNLIVETVQGQIDRLCGDHPYTTNDRFGQVIEVRGAPFSGQHEFLTDQLHGLTSDVDFPPNLMVLRAYYPSAETDQPAPMLMDVFHQVFFKSGRSDDQDFYKRARANPAMAEQFVLEQTANRPCLLIVADLDQTRDQPIPLAIKEKRATFYDFTKRGGFLEKFLVDHGNHGLVASTYGFQDWDSFAVRRRKQSFPLPGLTGQEIQDLARQRGQTLLPNRAELLRQFTSGHEGLVYYFLGKHQDSDPGALAASASDIDMEPEERSASLAQISLEYLEALLRENLPEELVDHAPQLVKTMARFCFDLQSLREDLPDVSPGFPALMLPVIGKLSSAGLIVYSSGVGYHFISPLREIAAHAQSVVEQASGS